MISLIFISVSYSAPTLSECFNQCNSTHTSEFKGDVCSVFTSVGLTGCCQAYCAEGDSGLQTYISQHIQEPNESNSIPKVYSSFKDDAFDKCAQWCRKQPISDTFGYRGIYGYCEAYCSGTQVDWLKKALIGASN